jgi:hypothetical protein
MHFGTTRTVGDDETGEPVERQAATGVDDFAFRIAVAAELDSAV